MKSLFAIDPGVHKLGIALFFEGRLIDARYRDLMFAPVGSVDRQARLIIEMPRIYPGSSQRKGDLNDILDLAAAVGFCEGRFDGPIERVFPAQWKGQVPKKIMNARVLSKLSADEKLRIESVGAKDHNTIDAIGIGLWKLGRL